MWSKNINGIHFSMFLCRRWRAVETCKTVNSSGSSRSRKECLTTGWKNDVIHRWHRGKSPRREITETEMEQKFIQSPTFLNVKLREIFLQFIYMDFILENMTTNVWTGSRFVFLCKMFARVFQDRINYSMPRWAYIQQQLLTNLALQNNWNRLVNN